MWGKKKLGKKSGGAKKKLKVKKSGGKQKWE